MEVTCKFTEDEKLNLITAHDALKRIKCSNVACSACPLYLRGVCMVNQLGYIVHEAERGGAR